jgi:hypothetical protein
MLETIECMDFRWQKMCKIADSPGVYFKCRPLGEHKKVKRSENGSSVDK